MNGAPSVQFHERPPDWSIADAEQEEDADVSTRDAEMKEADGSGGREKVKSASDLEMFDSNKDQDGETA